MKTLKNILIIIIGVFLIAVLVVSCLPKEESMGDAGQTLVKLFPSGFNMVAMDAKTTPQTGILFEVRRDVPNNTALNSTTSIELLYDASGAILTKYNAINGTSFIPLPTSLATTTPAISNGKITFDMAAGEFSKTVTVNVPAAANFDFSKQYALAFKLNTVSGTGAKSGAVNDTIVAQVLAKNKYDGVYTVTSNSDMIDIVVTTLTGYYPFEYKLVTTGSNTVQCIFPDYDAPYHPITSGGALSVYGAFGLNLTFDPATGAITSVSNPWGNPPSNTRMPVLDPSGINKWDATTKTIKFKYWMKQPSLVPAAPNIRTWFDETWKYKGPR